MDRPGRRGSRDRCQSLGHRGPPAGTRQFRISAKVSIFIVILIHDGPGVCFFDLGWNSPWPQDLQKPCVFIMFCTQTQMQPDLWRCGALARRSCGSVALWRPRAEILGLCGALARRSCGAVALSRGDPGASSRPCPGLVPASAVLRSYRK